MTAVYIGEGTRWSRLALLGAGDALTALGEIAEAVTVYGKLRPPKEGFAQVQDRETSGQAAYRIAEILQSTGQYQGASDMYLTAAALTPGAPAERRALVGAVKALVASGDRTSAEAIYRRLLGSKATEPEFLAAARRALGAGGASPDRSDISESALPRAAR
jgi:tetratricopeptide (TPR) repeat protein